MRASQVVNKRVKHAAAATHVAKDLNVTTILVSVNQSPLVAVIAAKAIPFMSAQRGT